jgi:hypothetical protein
LGNTLKLRILCFFTLGIFAISTIAIGQWLFAERNDITGERSILKISIDMSKTYDINPMPIVIPIYHYIPPAIGLIIALLLFNPLKFLLYKKNKAPEIMPKAKLYLILFFLFSIICFTAHMMTISMKIKGLAYGLLPLAFHVILAIIIGFCFAIDDWSYFKIKWNLIKNIKNYEVVEKFKLYLEQVIKTVNRTTLIMLFSATIGGWKILFGFSEMRQPIQTYHFNTLIFCFLICLIPILNWIFGPLLRLFEEVDNRYFQLLAEADSQNISNEAIHAKGRETSV